MSRIRVITSILTVAALALAGTSCEPLGTTFNALPLSYPSGKSSHLTIQKENEKAGNSDWRPDNPAQQHEIEGYASATSVNRGEDINLYVNTRDSSYTIEVYRMGWYGGSGARRVLGPVLRAGILQPAPDVDTHTKMVECDWQDPFVLHTQNPADSGDWASGIYLAKLSGLGSGKQSYIIFVVRDDERASDMLFQSSVTTYEAYNTWGEYSLYTKPRATHVSFNRPYEQGFGTGDFLNGRWELSMLRFLERNGYDVSYSTDIDTHVRGHLLTMHKAFLSVGHDEYWSWQMRDNVEQARNHGVSLGFFAANVSYFQIRLQPSRRTGDADRTIVCYKHAGEDPIRHSSDPQLARRITVLFRNFRVGRPEDSLVGVMYVYSPVHGDIVVDDAGNWVFEGTGLRKGDRLEGLLGYEVDEMYGNAPIGTNRVAHSPYKASGETRYSDMTVYSPAGGPTIFATGSMDWNYGLDEPVQGEPNYGPFPNAAAKQITRNVFARFGAAPHPY